jgi:hypothetical protein
MASVLHTEHNLDQIYSRMILQKSQEEEIQEVEAVGGETMAVVEGIAALVAEILVMVEVKVEENLEVVAKVVRPLLEPP